MEIEFHLDELHTKQENNRRSYFAILQYIVADHTNSNQLCMLVVMNWYRIHVCTNWLSPLNVTAPNPVLLIHITNEICDSTVYW